MVLEIGPGRGFLTAFLAERAGLVHAMELDPDVLPSLREAIRGGDNVVVHEGDALRFDYSALDPAPNRLVANLPYNIASPLVLALLEEVETLRTLRFMVQLEVARRMVAERGTKDYAAYAVLVQLLASVRILHRVPPTVFDPPPRVHSAVVEMERREQAGRLRGDQAPRARRFQEPPQTARQQPAGAGARAGSAGPGVPGYGPNARAEELAPEDFVALYAGAIVGVVMREVRLRAFAKVNYALDVLGLRADGYHEVSTVMQSISLADEVGMRRAAEGFGLSLDLKGWRPDRRNATLPTWPGRRYRD